METQAWTTKSSTSISGLPPSFENRESPPSSALATTTISTYMTTAKQPSVPSISSYLLRKSKQH
ncbi:hypothetical protein HanRHA438_Chr08g0333881 [Helianthus annuus]|nr:hypothetical protein HanRHA438_Chr08g0333881 [Helianthus annuus]